MSAGALREDIRQLFSNFFSNEKFHEISYFCDPEAFGNEVLELEARSGIVVRFARDRGQILVNVRSGTEKYQPVDLLLVKLGHGEHNYAYPSGGIPATLVIDLISDWSRLEGVVLSGHL